MTKVGGKQTDSFGEGRMADRLWVVERDISCVSS